LSRRFVSFVSRGSDTLTDLFKPGAASRRRLLALERVCAGSVAGFGEALLVVPSPTTFFDVPLVALPPFLAIFFTALLDSLSSFGVFQFKLDTNVPC
jgi:hypothetical protein